MLIIELYGKQIEFIWILGHIGINFQNRVDMIIRDA